MTRIVHITPHLGGGVGKAVSGLIKESLRSGLHEHTVVCLEHPEKTQFSAILERENCRLHYCPSPDRLADEIQAADIVQLEFWNHPATTAALCTHPLPPMRLLVWCHISGLHFPKVPGNLLATAGRFLFTSACSLGAWPTKPPHTDVVSSGGGMDELPPVPIRPSRRPLSAGYIGTLNFSKLHPEFVGFADAVQNPAFRIRMIGDEINREILEDECRRRGRPNLLQFCGYRPEVAAELAQLDILVYLLNPLHYGTAENTLLEAMAMGVVPIVLDNPAERHIVRDGQTGLIVRTREELANAVTWLEAHPQERVRIGTAAAETVRARHTYRRMGADFRKNYASLLEDAKQSIDFRAIFGHSPAHWFLAFQPENSPFLPDGSIAMPDDLRRHALLERTKGSVLHFHGYFPSDQLLSSWARNVRNCL